MLSLGRVGLGYFGMANMWNGGLTQRVFVLTQLGLEHRWVKYQYAHQPRVLLRKGLDSLSYQTFNNRFSFGFSSAHYWRVVDLGIKPIKSLT